MAYVAKSICQSPEESVSVGEGFERSYTKRFDVVLDIGGNSQIDITPLQVYAGVVVPPGVLGLPQYGDPWISRDGSVMDTASTMRSFTGRREHGDKAKFSFTFNFAARGAGRMLDPSTQANRFNNTGTTDDLTKLMPVWSVSFEDRMVPMWVGRPDDINIIGTDLDGIKLINSAGDPHDPGLERNEPIMVLNWSAYFTSFTATSLIGFKDRLNSDQFLLTGDNYKWWIQDLKMTPETVGMRRYYRHDFVFKFSEIGWGEYVLDAGYYQLKTGTATTPVTTTENYAGDFSKTNKKQILAPMTGEPVTRPWPLNGGGIALINSFDSLRYRVFRNKRYRSFADIGVTLP